MPPIEEWRPVVGFERLYSVSNLGRVRRDAGGGGNAKPGRILSQHHDRKGYVKVCLCPGDGRRNSYRIHRLVLAAFDGQAPTAEHQANHLNGNKTDNRPENLEWATNAENMAHAVAAGFLKGKARGEKNPAAKLTRGQVEWILHLFVTSESTIGDLALEFFGSKDPTPYMRVRRIVTRKTWAHVPCNETALAAAVERKHHADKKRPKKVDTTLAETLREAYAAGGRTYKTLAAEHGLTLDTVYRVVKRRGRYAEL